METYTKADIERFNSFVAAGKPDECWPWSGGTDRQGYGHFGLGGKTIQAHRFAFWFTAGIEPGDLCVCHSCDNPGCVNPAHLWLGTHKENMVDASKKGRLVGTGLKSVFNHEFVRQIRAKYAAGGTTLLRLANEYGICESTVSNIVNRKIYSKVI